MSKIWTDRSRILTWRRCPRMRWLEFHAGGTGIVPAKKSLALVMGTFVHEGLAALLRQVQGLREDGWNEQLGLATDWLAIEEAAVEVALEGWDKYVAENSVPELESSEQTWTAKATPEFVAPHLLSMPLGVEEEAGLAYPAALLTPRIGEFERYLQQEQRGLLEGMVRAYARRRLRPLLAEYEILEVEREGQWKLGEMSDSELWLASRPDALLLHRASQSLHLLSFKTTSAVELRKLADIQHDDQGLSEGIEIEKRLRQWWQAIQDDDASIEPQVSQRMVDLLAPLSAPPCVDAIRYEFLLKGERWKDKRLSEQMGFDCRSQKSPLVRAYLYSGRDNSLNGRFCWSWDYDKPDGSGKGSLNWQNWKAEPIWQVMEMKEWIDMLDAGMGQAVGEAGDALEQQFYPPQMVYRTDDDLRDWFEEIEGQEVRVMQSVSAISNIIADGDSNAHVRSLLNIFFPKNRSACEYPGRCPYADRDHGPCYGPAHARSVEAMLESGKYVRREPNHPQEKENGI